MKDPNGDDKMSMKKTKKKRLLIDKIADELLAQFLAAIKANA